MSNTANDLLQGGGPPAVKYSDVGDSVKGTIVKIETREAKDIKTGELIRFRKSNDVVQEIILTLRLDDGEERRDFVPQNKQVFYALREAVQKSGGEFEVGGTYVRLFAREEPASNAAFDPQKIFEVAYKPPSGAASAAALLGGNEAKAEAQPEPAPARPSADDLL